MTAPAPQPKTLDLGPITIRDCVFSKSVNPNGQYILTLDIGPHELVIITSPQGNSVHVKFDDRDLIA